MSLLTDATPAATLQPEPCKPNTNTKKTKTSKDSLEYQSWKVSNHKAYLPVIYEVATKVLIYSRTFALGQVTVHKLQVKLLFRNLKVSVIQPKSANSISVGLVTNHPAQVMNNNQGKQVTNNFITMEVQLP